MFGEFDFRILDDPVFKEDSVREELVVPILKRLGYTATGEHRIIRTAPLEHPFVHIGTKSHRINIFPDYQLLAVGKKAWVLDAKAPSEEIRSGAHVEQAFSYAIHPDVRVPLYALCNGRELVVYHISEWEPKIVMPLTEIDARWKEVNTLLCPMAFTNPIALNFLPDFGLSMLKMGLVNLETIFFPHLHFNMVAKARDDLYCLVSNFELGEAYCTAFDLEPEMYKQFLEAVSPKHRAAIEFALSQHPWQMFFEKDDEPHVTIGAVYAGYKVKTENEEYVPLKVVEVQKAP